MNQCTATCPNANLSGVGLRNLNRQIKNRIDDGLVNCDFAELGDLTSFAIHVLRHTFQSLQSRSTLIFKKFFLVQAVL